ncbi:hypothetical protein HDV04_003405 [Boothiomyces sp. JEL0838]|nr:hypothetical protein HDV04_003405 [Boothiomyces sp. JEL0838]
MSINSTIESLNKLNSVIKGSQLHLVSSGSGERLPASAGLPSAAGLYRSNTIGGDNLQGMASGKQFFTELLKETKLVKSLNDLSINKPKRKSKKKKSVSTSNIKSKTSNPHPIKSKSLPVINLATQTNISKPTVNPRRLLHSTKIAFEAPSLPSTPITSSASELGVCLKKMETLSSTKVSYPNTKNQQDLKQKLDYHIQFINFRLPFKGDMTPQEQINHAERMKFLEKRSKIIHINQLVKSLEEEKWRRRKANQNTNNETFEV